MTAGTADRNKEIVKYNILGIILNLILSVFKIIVGASVRSHAVMLDGVNSLSDLFSSILSILSVSLGSRRADRKHPLGYGRMEYVFSLIITIIILYVGVRSAFDGVRAILDPHEAPDYNVTVIIVMCCSLAAKVFYGLAAGRKGKELHSDALRITSVESFGDGFIAAAVLAAIAVYHIARVDIEHYLCILISVLIIYSGVQVAIGCMHKMLGMKPDPAVKREILNGILSEDGVQNVSNLVLHNYGENVYAASVDIQVEEDLSALEISRLSRRLIRHAAERGLTLTSVGISGIRTKDHQNYEKWDIIIGTATKYPDIVKVHSFILDPQENVISFYAACDRRSGNWEQELEEFKKELKTYWPEMTIEILPVLDL